MPTNYDILMQCSRKQMEQFIRSIVNKEASKYVNWKAWLSSEEPEAKYLGKDARLIMPDGTEKPVRYLRSVDKDGVEYRQYYTILDHGEVKEGLEPAEKVRLRDDDIKQEEPSVPAEEAPVAPEPKAEISEEEVIVERENFPQAKEETVVEKVEEGSEYVIGELLSEIKEKSREYDPDDPEDAELPTIAFTAILDNKDRF